MPSPRSLLTCLLVSVMVTLALAVVTILVLMFSVRTDSAYLTGLFGSVFFAARPSGSGGVVATMGVASLPRLLAVGGGVLLFCVVVERFYRALRSYRAQLLRRQGG